MNKEGFDSENTIYIGRFCSFSTILRTIISKITVAVTEFATNAKIAAAYRINIPDTIEDKMRHYMKLIVSCKNEVASIRAPSVDIKV
ncbi:hypothetical protein JFL43_09915 [Viridibacillus sp. YIM B01967]|uniref:Uncharacterized protein n=1 Tax=Viridibacillus soli TaxID=2798301 RepID=A0ABS1H6Z3_9BACL|nr:hypothetical protein [Viridibacillus soli]MBK3495165.1 hypothetical protein [Viridibacillus soli]